MRIPAAVNAVWEMYKYLDKWDANGKRWVSDLAVVGDLRTLVK